MTLSRHEHLPFSGAHIISEGDLETSTCSTCWVAIDRFWLFESDRLPYVTDWAVTK